MSQEKDFKRLQQRTYQSYHQDGLIDILIGMAVIGFGTYMALDNVAFLGFSWLPLILYVPLKNRITVPRIGYVKFAASRIRIFFSLFIAVLAVVLLGGIYYFVSMGDVAGGFSIWIREYYMLLLAGIAAIAFISAGFLTGIRRFYGYALLILVTFAAGLWLGFEPAVYVIVTGVLIAAVGLWLMVNFLREHPLLTQENAHE